MTPFGIEVRRLRKGRGITQKTMAEGLRMKPSLLSAIETGKRPIPNVLFDKIVDYLQLGERQQETLRQSIYQSVRSVVLEIFNHTGEKQVELIRLFYKKYHYLNDEQCESIIKILER